MAGLDVNDEFDLSAFGGVSMYVVFLMDEEDRLFSDGVDSANLDGGVIELLDPKDNCATVRSSSVRNNCFFEISNSVCSGFNCGGRV